MQKRLERDYCGRKRKEARKKEEHIFILKEFK
jgi:hypothetical protein